MMSEKSKENRNKWYRDHVNKYCVCVNKDEVEVVNGYKFKGCVGIARQFIDEQMEVKKNSKGAKRFIAKRQLNSVYGKFATNPNVTPKIPFIDKDDGILRLHNPMYTTFEDRVAYIDTDSIHCVKKVIIMMSEKSKENRNKWYRDHVNKYCVCVNKDEVEVVDYIEGLLKSKKFSKYVKNKIKEDLEKNK